MLQQTVVMTVIPYFEKWLRRFPDIETLAAAHEQEVLSIWEGLGYYGRARNIHRTAHLLMQRHGGRIPEDIEDLKRLPGIGEYTAAAIMSIAFGKPYPVLDANVRRVVSRLLAIRNQAGQTQETVKTFVSRVLPGKKPGLFNEALMEFGQRVCLSRKPICDLCPVAVHCQARRRNLQDEIPGRKSVQITRRELRILLLISRKRILAQRKTRGVFAGLWLLPTFPIGTDVDTAIVSLTGDCFTLTTHSLKTRTHHYTRFADRLTPVVCSIGPKTPQTANGWQWLKLTEICRYPFPSVQRKILDEYLAAWEKPASLSQSDFS